MRSLLAASLLLSLALPALADDIPVSPPAASAPTPAAADSSEANGGVPDLPAGTVYLLARIQLNGTDLAMADFFQEKTITTLDDCEKERAIGMTSGWQAYHHYLQTYKGMSYKVEYRCVISDQRLSVFRYGQPAENFYLVRTGEDGHMHLEHFRNFFACRDTAGAHGQHESVTSFCAKTSQSLIQD